MGCCYFGKLPARSDFVIGQCPKGFLKLWEPFVMQGLAQSRLDLGGAWRQAYMTMPVWRFEIMPDPAEGNAPEAVLGAFMPSVDGVGREYPLMLAASPGPVAGIDTQGWFEQAEIVLRSALLEETDLSDFQKAVESLDLPDARSVMEKPKPGCRLAAAPDTRGKVSSRFWCRGGETEFAFGCGGLPDATEFRWLLLPERFSAAEEPDGLAGENHGRYYPEDHRT
ncbi:type VI secretion system-associated protein TagF [Roseibium sp. AS2]|uniref:type VI secretion system-associated protein TagF n=1 Tax=Roseibium sp. AS2 TaxID=3135781 RepID=UPI003175BA1C